MGQGRDTGWLLLLDWSAGLIGQATTPSSEPHTRQHHLLQSHTRDRTPVAKGPSDQADLTLPQQGRSPAILMMDEYCVCGFGTGNLGLAQLTTEQVTAAAITAPVRTNRHPSIGRVQSAHLDTTACSTYARCTGEPRRALRQQQCIAGAHCTVARPAGTVALLDKALH